jgi:hypothetical protein
MLEARAMIEPGQFGSELADSVHYIAAMLELAVDELGRVGEAAGQYTRELAPSIGDALARLDPLLQLAVKELGRAGDAAGESARGLAAGLGEAIDRLDALLRP